MALSTSGSDRPQARLIIDGQNATTELFVVDGHFNIVARGVHRLDTRLVPGIYRIDARLGGRDWKHHIALERDEIVIVPLIEFGSASPLWNTSRTHEFHVALAEEVSRAPGEKVGMGAEIFIMSRTWTSRNRNPSPSPEPNDLVSRVRLRRWRGDVIADLHNSDIGKKTSGQWDLAVAVKIEVNPGTYIIEAETPTGPIMQVLFAHKGWQTQAFILHDHSNPKAGPSIDFSLFMSRGSFNANDKIQYLTESGRIALADERSVASDELIQFASSKFENPILGLISAHLLLIAKQNQQRVERQRARQSRMLQTLRQPEAVSPIQFSQSYFDEIVGNTRGLLGADHPDVYALMTQSSDGADPAHKISVPPLFWRSWKLLIEASNDNLELIPMSLWQRVESGSTLRPHFSWMKHERPAMPTFSEAMGGVQESFAIQAQLQSETVSSLPTDEKPRPDQLRDWASQNPSFSSPEAVSLGPEQLDPLKREMTRQLNLPRGVLDQLFSDR